MDSGSQSDSSASSEDVFDSAKTLAAHLKRRRRKARTLHPEALHLCAGHPLVAHMVLPPAAVCVSQTRHREEREQAGAEERKQAGAEERKQAGAEEQEQAGAEERKQDVEKNFSPSQDAKGRNESQREKESLLGNKSSPKPQTPHAEIVSHAVNEEDEAPTPPPRAPAALPPDAAAPTRSETAPRPDYTLRSETEPKPDCTLRSETEPKPDCTLRSVAPSSSRARWSVEASWWRRRLREAITSRSHARCRLEAAQLPPRARPLLVFVSTRSGAQEGAALRLRLLRLLHPLQVVELPQQDPLRALELFAHLPGLRVLVAGGDGTVSWILSALDLLRTRVESERKEGRGGREEGAEGGERNGCGQGDAAPHVQAWRPPPVGILPMGTGNDLARVLQWGAGAGAWAGLSATKVLCEADSAAVSLLDRWHLELEEEEQPGGAKGQGGACDAEAVAGRDSPPRDPPSRPDGSQPPQNAPTSPTVPSSIPRGLAAGWRLADAAAASLRRPRDIPTMTNYLGVGTDAMVALDFHRLRESFPGWFRSQWGNKIVYGLMATLDALRAVRSPPDLRDAVELECDGELVPLPPGMQGLILLNIHSFMGGVDLWGQGRGTGRPPAGRPEEWRSPSPAGRAMDACPSGTSLSRARSEQLPWSRHGNGAPSTKEPCSASPVPRPAASGSAADPFSQASPAPAPGALGPQLAWDGRLEVLAVRGALHLGAARVGLSEPLRLRQCARARLRFRKALPMQVDGEAWVQGPGTIAVRRESQARMLRRVAQPLARVVRAAQDVLDASLAQGVVSAEQHALLSQQLTLRLMEALPST